MISSHRILLFCRFTLLVLGLLLPRTLNAQVVTTYAEGISGAHDLVFDTAGNLYVSCPSFDVVYKVGPGGAPVTQFVTGIDEPIGLAFDAAGKLYVVESTNPGRVWRVEPSGTKTVFVTLTGVADPWNATFDDTGNLYVTSIGKVTKITPSAVATDYATGLHDGASTDVSALEFALGDLYVGVGSTIQRIGSGGSPVTTIATDLVDTKGLARGFSGEWYTGSFGGRRVMVAPASSGAGSTYAGALFPDCANGERLDARFTLPTGLRSHSDGYLYIADQGCGAVKRMQTGAMLPGYALVWSDDFNGTQLDPEKWGYTDGAKGMTNMTPDAISLNNGFLTIRTYREASGTYSSGMIQTAGYGSLIPQYAQFQPPGNKYLPRYGYIEARIQFEDKPGMWSSFWLQTLNNSCSGDLDGDGDIDGLDEHLRGMEIDIVEHKVTDDNGSDVSDQAPSNVHFLSYASPHTPESARNFHRGGGAHHSGSSALDIGFHTYGLEWTPDYLRVFYDNIPVWTVYNSTEQHPLCTLDPGSPPCEPGSSGCCLVGPCFGQSVSECVYAPVPHFNFPPDHDCLEPPDEQTLGGATGLAIILNPEVSREGNYGPPGWVAVQGGPDINPPYYGPRGDPANPKMIVDYVRHYQRLVPPTSLTAVAQSASQISLTWVYNTWVEPNGFAVERSTDNVNFSLVGSVLAGHTFLDTGLAADTRYWYRVYAYIGDSHSAYSNKPNAITDVIPPAAITDLSAPPPGNTDSIKKTSMAISWTAPGDDGTGQRVIEYDLRRSTSLITAANFNAATRVGMLAPNVSGYSECRVVTGLSSNTNYYFAIKSRDDAGYWSGMSNVTNRMTPNTGTALPLAVCSPLEGEEIAPASVADLEVDCVISNTTMKLTWTAPGDDGATGTAAEYDLRYSTSSITASNFGSATRFTISAPSLAETVESASVTGLSCPHTYYFALKTRDEWDNWSEISNVETRALVCNQVDECDEGGGAAKLPDRNDEAMLSFSAPTPNPARGATNFRISVPANAQGGKLRVEVFDVAGRRVRSLIDRTANPGTAQIHWNLRDDSGHRVASGVYMMRVDVGDTRKTFRLVVVR
jgi:hypothetical protein